MFVKIHKSYRTVLALYQLSRDRPRVGDACLPCAHREDQLARIRAGFAQVPTSPPLWRRSAGGALDSPRRLRQTRRNYHGAAEPARADIYIWRGTPSELCLCGYDDFDFTHRGQRSH